MENEKTEYSIIEDSPNEIHKAIFSLEMFQCLALIFPNGNLAEFCRIPGGWLMSMDESKIFIASVQMEDP